MDFLVVLAAADITSIRGHSDLRFNGIGSHNNGLNDDQRPDIFRLELSDGSDLGLRLWSKHNVDIAKLILMVTSFDGRRMGFFLWDLKFNLFGCSGFLGDVPPKCSHIFP